MITLQERIEFDNALEVCQQGIEKIQSSNQDVHIDCQSLRQFQSVILSVLLCWMRQCKKQRLNFVLVNAPKRLKEMARVYGLATCIPL